MNITHVLKLSGLSLIILSIFSNVAQARPTALSCAAGHTISKTFSSGATWDMCWETRDQEGVVLSEIHFTAKGDTRRRVLSEAGLGQIQTEYDDGSPTEFPLTDAGLGASHLQTLTADMCDGVLHADAGRNVVCAASRANGYVYRYRTSQKQGDKFEVYSISSVGSREYIVRWGFLENGTIEPAIAVTGLFSKNTTSENHGWKVTAEDKISVSFVDHYFWRLDFDIGSNGANDIIEQIKSVPSTDRLTKTKQVQTISTELADSFTPADKKFWRIKDQSLKNASNKAISYEMVMLNYAQQNKGNSTSPWLKSDVFFTQYNACERFATNNPTTNNCGSNVSEFVNAEATNTKDIVVWYRLAHHTLPRDEDFSPVAPQWSSFLLLPRDWTSTNSL